MSESPKEGTGMDKDLARLDAFQREAWEDDLDLRRRAKDDPELAEIVAAADAAYLLEYGHPWVNPLA